MKVYYIYKITNILNGKIYIGAHQTDNLEDDYMGSGTALKYAIEKYGIEHFKKDILQFFDSAEDMFNAESILVNEEFVKNPSTYNMVLGGNGGWNTYNLNSDIQSQKGKKSVTKQKLLAQTDEKWKNKRAENCSKASKKVWDNLPEDIKRERIETFSQQFKGKSHSEETKRRIGKTISEHQKGEKNSQFGTCWIYNEQLKENKKIDKKELEQYISDGWIKGRKQKF